MMISIVIDLVECYGFDFVWFVVIDVLIKVCYFDLGCLLYVQLLIVCDGEVVYFLYQGVVCEGGVLIDEILLFWIVLMIKLIMLVVFMMLVEEGKVVVDMLVYYVLFEFKDIVVYNGGGVGILFVMKLIVELMWMIDLLWYMFGFIYGFQNCLNVDVVYCEGKIENWYGNFDFDGFIGVFGKLLLEFLFGIVWNYLVVIDVLGVVVECVLGMMFDVFFVICIFVLLKMDDIFFQVLVDKVDWLVDCYMVVLGKGWIMFDCGEVSVWVCLF